MQNISSFSLVASVASSEAGGAAAHVAHDSPQPSFRRPDPRLSSNGQQIRSSMDMVRVYNYGPHSLQSNVIVSFEMKNLTYHFKQLKNTLLQKNNNGLYSPAAASDSSGFSDFPSYATTFNPAIRPQASRPSLDRSLSPQVPHSYHNPTLIASPYSTLPRRPQAASMVVRNGPPPIMASAVGRNSPLLELTGVSNNRSSSLGRNTSLHHTVASSSAAGSSVLNNGGRPPVAVRSPLMDDDRESCV